MFDEKGVEVFVARHAIFDRRLTLFGYELLFRSCSRNSAEVTSDTASTLQVLSNSLLASGFEALACSAPAFINFGRELLTTNWTSLFPPQSVVIEILETIEPDPDVIAACRNLKEMGYLLALDDVVDERGNDELMEIINFVKVDFRQTTRDEQLRIAKSLRRRGKRLIAEKVETHEEFAWACQSGYDYFQGFFFAKPMLLRGQAIPSVKVNSLRLLRELQYPDLDLDRLEGLVSCDISLTYKLFRYVNSALFARSKALTNVKEALIFMGELDIRRWSTLATLPALASGSAPELIVHALVRAKFCEMLAQAAAVQPASDAFLVGMFSLIDALLDRPLTEILVELNLPLAIRAALLGTQTDSDMSLILEMALRYEAGEWSAIEPLLLQMPLHGHTIPELYLQAISWSNEMFSLVETEPPGRSDRAVALSSEDPASGSLLSMNSALGKTRVNAPCSSALENTSNARNR